SFTMASSTIPENSRPTPMHREPLNKSDWSLIAICLAVVATSLFVVFNWFGPAFPEASIDFRYDRDAACSLAEVFLRQERIDTPSRKHSAVFDGDDTAKIFLERSLGL